MDELDKLRKKIINSDTFCFYPYLEISTRPNGSVLPCCYWDEQVSLFQQEKITKSNPIENFWNNNKVITIRKSLHEGKVLEGCNICARDGDASMRARSIRENINNRDYLQLVYDTILNNGKANHTPRRLEIKPSNLCNLKCVMCNAYDSSQIEKELHELSKKYNGIKTYGGRFNKIVGGRIGVWEGNIGEFELPDMANSDWAESEEFWDYLKIILPNLNVLSFAGGEPTINPIVHKVLQYCVENNYAKNITVFISSNFTNLNKKFFQLMPHFNKFELIASIDGIGPVQEYVRFPSDWETIKRNFETARAYMKYPNVKILINITVHILNIFYLDELLNYIDNKFLEYPYYKEWPYNINLLNYPEELKIDWIPESLKTVIIDKIKTYQNNSTTLKFFPELKIKTDLLISELSKISDIENSYINLNHLHTIIKTLDTHRESKYKESLPILDNIFESKLSHDK